MRDRTAWRRGLEKQLRAPHKSGRMSLSPTELLEIELAIFAMQEVLPDRDIAGAWVLFTGYPIHQLLARTTPEQERMLRRARLLLPTVRGRKWRQQLDSYDLVSEEFRGYRRDTAGGVTRLKTSWASDRFDVFLQTLSSPLPWSANGREMGGPGSYTFKVGEVVSSAIVPEWLLDGVENRDAKFDLPHPSGSIQVSWEELDRTARFMDKRDLELGNNNRNWAKRLSGLRLKTRDGDWSETSGFTLSDIFHLVGAVGAGKSTLRDVLTVWLARSGRRVTIVVADVAEVMTTVETLRQMNVAATPIVGATTRMQNAAKLHARARSRGLKNFEQVGLAYDYVSTVCQLDGLRSQVEDLQPLEVRDQPCERVVPSDSGREKICPLWSSCPKHTGSRELSTATVWVSTPPGLLHGRVPAAISRDNIKSLEAAWLRSDLIIVDEVDRVQLRLDSDFAPATGLVGPDSWVDNARAHLDKQISEDRTILRERRVHAFDQARNNIYDATNWIFSKLNGNPALLRWVSGDYFSALTLHLQLIRGWFPQGDEVGRERANSVLNDFRDDPLNGDRSADPMVGRLVEITGRRLRNDGEVSTREILEVVQELVPSHQSMGADMQIDAFEFTLVLSVLHHQLAQVSYQWPEVQYSLRLDSTHSVLSLRPPLDYYPRVPTSPMGNVLGFRYRASDTGGELSYFRCAGVGRALLTSLSSFAELDDRPAPAVLLMSGTSWAGPSTRYHLSAPVQGILLPGPDVVDGVSKSSIRVQTHTPAGAEPIRVSGSPAPARKDRLCSLVQGLAQPPPGLHGMPSDFEQELETIEGDNRKRLLLVVNSYEQAVWVSDTLEKIPRWQHRVVRLVSDAEDDDPVWVSSGQTLARGDIHTFPLTDAEILVAPLMAVERGHNIVTNSGEAAIGCAYFLVRPHPRPDDLQLAVSSINDWAMRECMSAEKLRKWLKPSRDDSLDDLGRRFRFKARDRWRRTIGRDMRYSSLETEERLQFAWDQMVVIWQVLGRLVRGGMPARAVFADAAFLSSGNTRDGLLATMADALAPYFREAFDGDPFEQQVVQDLYGPFHMALEQIKENV